MGFNTDDREAKKYYSWDELFEEVRKLKDEKTKLEEQRDANHAKTEAAQRELDNILHG